jgi:hypothetical protein
LGVSILFALIFCLVATVFAEAAAGSCEALNNLQLPDTRLLIAESVTPNPEWPIAQAAQGRISSMRWALW